MVADSSDPSKSLIELRMQQNLELLHLYEGRLRLSSDPKESHRFQSEINELKAEIAWLQQELGEDTPADRLVEQAVRLWIQGELHDALELLEQARTINPYRRGLGGLARAIQHELGQPWVDPMTGRIIESAFPHPVPAYRRLERRPLWLSAAIVLVLIIAIIALTIGLFFLLRFFGVI